VTADGDGRDTAPPAAGAGKAAPSLHALTGLRFFAALHVVLYHFGLNTFAQAPAWVTNFLHAGYVGVSLFFILSGFILTYVYLDTRGTRPVHAGKFWVARFARIYPMYLLSLLLWLPFFIGTVQQGFVSPLTGLLTAVLAPLGLQAWLPSTACVWNCPTWSVSVEAFFYLMFPFVAMFLYPRLRVDGPARAALLIAGLWLIALLPPLAYVTAERAGAFDGNYLPWLEALKFNPLSRFAEFVLGIALGKLFITRRAQGRDDARLGGTLVWASTLALLVGLSVSSALPYPFLHNGLLAPVFAALIYGLGTGRDAITRALSLPTVVLLGEASYSLYVLHGPVWDWLYKGVDALGRAGNANTSPAYLAAYLVLLVAVSVAAFRLIEIPARDYLRARLSGRPGPASGARSDRPARRMETWVAGAFGVAAAVGLLLAWPLGREANVKSRAEPAARAATAGAFGNVLDPAALAAGLEQGGWRPFSGRWSFRDGALVQDDPSGYDRGMNTVGTYAAPFVLRVGFSLAEGAGAGVLFNAPRVDGKAGAHMVRYTDDGAGIFWGAFDENGTFTGQGFAQALPAEKANRHVLEVRVAERTYGIVLDGRQLTDGIPLLSTSGHVGLHSSLSRVSFNLVEILRADGQPAEAAPNDVASGQRPPATPQNAAPGGASNAPAAPDVFRESFEGPLQEGSWVATAGTWELAAGAIRETTLEGYDQALVQARAFNGPYTLSVAFRHDQGAGGGVLFNAPRADDKAGAHMVRYSDDGTSIIWGSFTDAGDFTGQGSATVPDPGSADHELSVRVRTSAYEVTLDGAVVARDVPLLSKSGHVALQSSAGAVTFTRVEVTPHARP